MNEFKHDEPRIVCAANRHEASLEIVTGARHFDHLMHESIRVLCALEGMNPMDKTPYALCGERCARLAGLDLSKTFVTSAEQMDTVTDEAIARLTPNAEGQARGASPATVGCASSTTEKLP